MGRIIKADFPGTCSANCGKTWQIGESFYWDKWQGPDPKDPTKTIEIKVKCSDQTCFEKQGGKLEATAGAPRQGKSIKTRIEQVTALDATIFTIATNRAVLAMRLPADAEGFKKYMDGLDPEERFNQLYKINNLAMQYAQALATGFSA